VSRVQDGWWYELIYCSIALCGIYYLAWAKWLPKIQGHKLRQIVITLPDGSVSHEIIKVNNADIEIWDAKHDPSGRSLNESEAQA
jgi:hypothetical protein